MNDLSSTHVVLANGAKGPSDVQSPLRLNYIPGTADRVIRTGLPNFVRDVYHLPPRILDLLEIAIYVFAADRLLSRGPKSAVEYRAWSRSLQFHIRVREHDFWSQPSVVSELSDALKFMTGDADYSFCFEPGHDTPPTNLFDRPGFSVQSGDEVRVALFSGGLDSLCGVLELLESDRSKVILVSHQSQTGTIRTQNALVEALKVQYPDRVLHYTFACTLRGIRAREETQRTRSFLYTSIAYAIASAYHQDAFHVYENGITSVNLHRREDLANSRASRTTHPQTMGRMAKLFSMLAGAPVTINLPFLYKTKPDVIAMLLAKAPDLISSAVSCTRTFQTLGQATHCGYCFQCVDRRIASHAAEADNRDHRGLYTHDIITSKIDDREARTTLVDYVRQAITLAESTPDSFEDEYLTELADLLDYSPMGTTDEEKLQRFWELFKRHGLQVKESLARMRHLYDDLSQPLSTHSLLHIVSSREYLKPEQSRLVESIILLISPALGDMFSRCKPLDETDLNEKLGALLRTHYDKLQSEHPTVSFACAKVVPDHQLLKVGVLIEAKYIRKRTSPSQATEGIAADLTKYPPDAFVLFVVYDPTHQIHSDSLFREEIEAKGRNRVIIIR